MQRELTGALQADGIDAGGLDDKEFVVRVARWLLAHSKFQNMFCTHYVEFADGQPIVPAALKAKFDSDKGDPAWTAEQQFEHELFGRSMFANRTHGTCTSTAVYLTTVLRAVGIPTRMVLAVPLVDATDSAQLSMVENNLKHQRVRRTALLGLAAAKGYSNHTFNEVFVGGRWVRLNYSTLGQNILDAHVFGVLTHVNTFSDLSEARLAATWGRRYALGEKDKVFPYGNPYRTVELADQFGKFARIENPAAPEHRALTLGPVYWLDSPAAPKAAKESKLAANMDPRTGYLVAHIDEWFPEESFAQYRIFLQGAAKDFLFQATGQPDVRGRYWGTITDPPDVHELVIAIAPDELAKMKSDVAYVLVPQNGSSDKRWKMQEGVTLKRDR